MKNLTVAIGADHRGFLLKSIFNTRLIELGHTVLDVGTHTQTSCDASDFAQKVAADLARNPQYRGILICGSGQAMAMTANRFQNIRAALCTNSTMARLAREHNDANVLVLGAHITGQEVALDCLNVFMTTDFLGGRFEVRRNKLTSLGGL